MTVLNQFQNCSRASGNGQREKNQTFTGISGARVENFLPGTSRNINHETDKKVKKNFDKNLIKFY
tara:strand:- start:1338 stop:1532 length:195 start_codon:yes stop_codon:yes gene_type:complete